jgi:hypothetical protein
MVAKEQRQRIRKNAADRDLAQKIRKAVAEKALSTYTHAT